jgi:ParB-like chromosome segregation protein Spo0J
MILKETLLDNLKKSAEDIGQLYPVLVDADTGEVLDGKTRLKADPNWRKETVKVEDPIKKLKIKPL